MKVLGFERSARSEAGYALRERRFDDRSSLPITAACLVANSIREKLAALFRTSVSLRLLEPVIPSPDAWPAIACDAEVFGLRGQLCDAAIVLQREDALTLAAALFGESQEAARALSPLENELLFRTVQTLASALTPLCGLGSQRPARIKNLRGFVTYFELLLEAPFTARIGLAMSRDTPAVAAPEITPVMLDDVTATLSVQIACGYVGAGTLLQLRPGSCLKLETRLGDAAVLRAGSHVLGRGECGEFEEAWALLLQ